MAQMIPVGSSLLDGSSVVESSKKDGAKALMASLYQMEQLLETVSEEEQSKKGKGDPKKVPMNDNYANVFDIESALLEDPKSQAARDALFQYSEEVRQVGIEHVKHAIQTILVPAIKKMAEKSSSPLRNSDPKATPEAVPKATSKDGGLAAALMFLQDFQEAIAEQQITQSTNAANMGSYSTQVAQNEVNKVAVEIQKAERAAEEAGNRPWWETFVQVAAVFAGTILAFSTGGAGAAVVALTIGAIMASPASTELTAVIAKAIIRSQGGAGTDGNESDKKNAIANILAKIIVAAVFAVFSAGVSTLSTLMGTAENMALDAGEDAADAAANDTTSKIGNALKSGAKVGGFEGLSSVVSSGIAMDSMMAIDPAWAKKSKIAEALSVIISLIAMLVTAKCGAKTFAGMGSESSLLVEKYATAFKVMIPVSYLAQMTQGGVEAGLAIKRAEYFKQQAKFTKELGESQAALSRTYANLDILSDAAKSINDTGSSITQMLMQETNTLADTAGGPANTVNQILASG